MRIRSVEPIPLAYRDPNRPNPDPRNREAAYILLVKVVTDEGLVGWGETWTRFPEANRAVVEIVRGIEEVLIGEDPTKVEELHDALSRRMYWYGEGGIAWLALSAIDIALWDIRGKFRGKSLVEMLGGPAVPHLPAVTSSHPHGTTIDEMVEIAVATTEGITQGYKFGMTPGGDQNLGFDHRRDVAFVGGLREALGANAIIVADARAAVGWDVETAAERAAAFDELGMLWLEEPLVPWDREGYRQLKALTSLRLGFGEREWTQANYQRVLEDGLSDVLGIDHGRIGGVTSSWRVAQAVRDAGVHFNSHSWSGSILSAVGLAISCASGAALMYELKPVPDVMQTELVANPIVPSGKVFSPPSTPGIGVEIIEEVARKYKHD